VSSFWDVRACDKVQVTKTRGSASVTIIAEAGELIWEPGRIPYWTTTLGGVFFYEYEDFVEQEIEILERKG